MERRVTVQVKSGAEFEGILHGPVLGSKNIHITLKDARRLDKSLEGDENEGMIETLVIPAGEFVQMTARGVPHAPVDRARNELQLTQAKNEGSSKTGSEYTEEKLEYEVLPVKDENDMSGFMGDIDRAAGNKRGVERTLVAWSGGDAVGDDFELKGDASGWCQFSDQANSRVRSTFNMDDYTSKIDIEKSRYTEEDAARIAREIETDKIDLPDELIDDSGVFDEQVNPPAKEEMPKSKPFSWADAVKGKTTPPPMSEQQTAKREISEIARKTPEGGSENLQPSPTFQKVMPKYQPASEGISHQITGGVDFDGGQSFVDQRSGGQTSFGFDSSEALYLNQQQSAPPDPVFVPAKDQEPVFGTFGYSLSSGIDPAVVEDRSTGFVLPEKVPENRAAAYYRDPVWAMQANEPAPVKTEVVPETEPLNRALRESTPENPVVSPVVPKPEIRKTTSKVSAGISFKDKLTANLPHKTQKPATPVKKAPSPAQSGHAHTKSQSSVVDHMTDPIVQSPRGKTDAGRTYSGKLISNPRRSQLHSADAGRGLPSEEHLLSPMTGPPAIIYPSPPHEATPSSISMMPPPMVHGGYPEMPHEGPPPRGHYGSYGGPMDAPSVAHPGVMAVMPPLAHYPGHPRAAYAPVPDATAREEHEMDAGLVRRPHQLNPNAKAFKPVSSLERSASGPEPYRPPQYAAQPPVEYVARTPHGEVIPPIQHPPTGPPPQGTPKHPPGPGEAVIAEYNGNPLPGVRPPFIPPSNVVTPWPSFPGTGVWHSTLGAPRPGTPQANAMMNGFMPPGIPPGAYPMFVPGMPPPYMGGMQDPMWRPPPPHHVPDQQSVALLWRNYYSQIVPPNKRMWNPNKFPGHGMMSRPRNHRRPSNGSNSQQSANFQTQSPAAQQREQFIDSLL